MSPDFWDHVVVEGRARRWRDVGEKRFWRFPPIAEKAERHGNANWFPIYEEATAEAMYRRKGMPTVVHDPWNRKRRTNVHNAKSNSKSTPFASLYGISR